MADASEYRRAYEAARKELKELLEQQAKLEKRLVIVRQNVQGLAALCESESIQISRSPEAGFLNENSSLPDEIVNLLNAKYPDELRPSDIKRELKKLGRDMSIYKNALATIHMVTRRLVEAGKVRERVHAQGFKVYQAARKFPTLIMK